MTAFLLRVTSGLRMWLGWDSATLRGFGLGRPGGAWPTWSLRTAAAPMGASRVARPARAGAPSGRVCVR
jgi:hypothetical protein